MAKAKKFDIEMTYLHVGREEMEKYASIDDGDDAVTKKEPSQDEVPYMGVPVPPAPCPSSDGFYDERLPAPEGTSSADDTEVQKADENEQKYLEIVHDVKTNERKSDKVRQVEKLGSPVITSTSSYGFYAERLPASESSSVSEATLNRPIEMTYLHKVDEKVQKYLEIVDDVTKQECSSNGHNGYEVPVPRAHHYENPEERRHSDFNIPGTSAHRRVNPHDSPQSSDELLNVPGTSGDRRVNPAVSPRQTTLEPMETTAPLYEEIK